MKVVIIGAGPAGLASANELLKSPNKLDIKIIEKGDRVGGLSKTQDFKGYLFDVGPHRFFTKNPEVLSLWKETLGKDFLEVNRLTRILYNNKLFLYPVQFKDVLQKLGLIDNFQSFTSYLYAKVFLRNLLPKTFEEWITKNFGSKLYRVFFKTYTEKVWGIPCNQIGADWASQRIKNLSFAEVLKSSLTGHSKAKTLVDKFYYPLSGAGQMYQALADSIKKKGGKIVFDSTVTRINHQENTITSVEYQNGKKVTENVDYLLSTMPLTQLILSLSPLPPKEVVKAAKKLYFRDHINVNLIIKRKTLFPDNWIYVHSPEVKFARIADYNNFSSKMSKDSEHTIISVEYFTFVGDEIWQKTDTELLELAKQELSLVNLVNPEDVGEGFVSRETESYPTYFIGYKPYLEIIKNYLNNFKNLQLIGRGGMYKYNNMDHSIYSGILAARNLQEGKNVYNLWAINEDAQYQEEGEYTGK